MPIGDKFSIGTMSPYVNANRSTRPGHMSTMLLIASIFSLSCGPQTVGVAERQLSVYTGGMAIAELIKDRRTHLGMSQRQLASVSGLSNSEISRIESGERKSPSPQVLYALSAALDIPYEILMTEAGHRPVQGASPKMPEWVYSLPPDLYEFVKDEASRGWPYMRLARGMSEENLSPGEVEAIVATWVEAKRKYEKRPGRRK